MNLADSIRQIPNYQKLPLVMLTSLGFTEKNLQQNGIAFLHKPLKQSSLYNILVLSLSGQIIAANRAQAPRTQLNSHLAENHPLRILLAEDFVVNQQMALLILERMGYRADVVSNGLEVLSALQRQSYDVVLMDVQMPEMDGLEATRRICQKYPVGQRPRMIAMTANAMQGDREICLEAGMDDYISKPIRVEDLVKALSKCQLVNSTVLEQLEITETPLIEAVVEPNQISPAIDAKKFQAMIDMAGNNAAVFIPKLIDAYLQESMKLVQKMREAVHIGDAKSLQQAAHKLKSSSASLGAIALANLCQEIETIGRTGNIVDSTQKLDLLSAEYERVRVALQLERQRGNL